MRLLIFIPLAAGMIFAQAQNTPADPNSHAGQPGQTRAQPGQTQPATTDQTQPTQNGRPADQADRPGAGSPAGQAAPRETTPGATTPGATTPGATTPGASSNSASPSSASAGASATTYMGTIVNANCSQASNLPNSSTYSAYAADRGGSASAATPPAAGAPQGNTSSANSTDQGASKSTTGASASGNKNPKSVYDLERDVLRHCAAGKGVTTFALLTDDGRFFKLNDAGNSQVMTAVGGDEKHKGNPKNMRVQVSGMVQGDTLNVQSLQKSEKPFAQ